MNVETEKLELSDALPLVLSEISKDKEQIRLIDDLLVESHGISRGTLNEVLVNSDKINQMNELELVSFISVLFESTKDDRINPRNFYSEKEIKKGQKYKNESEEALTLPYTFNDYFVI